MLHLPFEGWNIQIQNIHLYTSMYYCSGIQVVHPPVATVNKTKTQKRPSWAILIYVHIRCSNKGLLIISVMLYMYGYKFKQSAVFSNKLWKCMYIKLWPGLRRSIMYVSAKYTTLYFHYIFSSECGISFP